jgi:hypothetical protein
VYRPGTILKLKEPRSVAAVKEDKAKNIKGQKEELFPYDEVEVVGISPIARSGGTGWDGVAGQGVIIKPRTAFGGLLDEPEGKLIELYEVVFEPDGKPQPGEPDYVKIGPSPEDVFKREAGSVPKSATRQKTPHSPL